MKRGAQIGTLETSSIFATSPKKAHFAVDDEHIIHGVILTKKDTMDFQVVEELCEQVDVDVDHVSADKMYDTDDVYDALTNKFPESDIAIPPKENLYADDAHISKRMSSLVAYSALGPMGGKRKSSMVRGMCQRMRCTVTKQLLAPNYTVESLTINNKK